MNHVERANARAKLKSLAKKLTLSQVAAELGMSISGARNLCKTAGYTPRDGRFGNTRRKNERAKTYAKWDWSKSSTELAAQHGKTRQAVSLMRLQLERDQLIKVFPRRGKSPEKVAA